MKKRRKKRKLNKKKVILCLLLLCFVIYIFINSNNKKSDNYVSDDYSPLSNLSNNDIDNKKDKNSNYLGIGQEKINNQDGYFTTFTTEDLNKKTYIEYKQNGNSPWAEKDYWGGTMEENGCGITSIAIILSGYNKGITPDDLREKYYPVLDGEKISYELSNTFNIDNSNFYYDDVHLSDDYIIEHLKSNRPVLVCIWNKPTDNRWTVTSHYMVLLAADDNHMVYVSNPNGLENADNSSGWYDIGEISTYLAKVLFIEEN